MNQFTRVIRPQFDFAFVDRKQFTRSLEQCQGGIDVMIPFHAVAPGPFTAVGIAGNVNELICQLAANFFVVVLEALMGNFFLYQIIFEGRQDLIIGFPIWRNVAEPALGIGGEVEEGGKLDQGLDRFGHLGKTNIDIRRDPAHFHNFPDHGWF